MAAFLKKIALLTAVALALAASSIEATEPVAIIVNRANQVDKLTEGEVKKIYTNNTLAWPDGVPIIIYDLSINDQSRAIFSEKILGKAPDLVAEEWAHLKITNQAKNPPQIMKTPTLIIRRVMREKGAIGYVSIGLVQNNPDVKVISTLR
ncbi:MAG: hypothetical protein A2X99_07485 [Deltaproteobacteria bacterium GWB2_55_19]|nr:MAG: hypothetical protein A2X99_07485 [Deltaproteobacteria bacterium GWB2_55_19]HAO93711.1 hypothetical protein [Deltaproteobacteria bacterium]